MSSTVWVLLFFLSSGCAQSQHSVDYPKGIPVVKHSAGGLSLLVSYYGSPPTVPRLGAIQGNGLDAQIVLQKTGKEVWALMVSEAEHPVVLDFSSLGKRLVTATKMTWDPRTPFDECVPFSTRVIHVAQDGTHTVDHTIVLATERRGLYDIHSCVEQAVELIRGNEPGSIADLEVCLGHIRNLAISAPGEGLSALARIRKDASPDGAYSELISGCEAEILEVGVAQGSKGGVQVQNGK